MHVATGAVRGCQRSNVVPQLSLATHLLTTCWGDGRGATYWRPLATW